MQSFCIFLFLTPVFAVPLHTPSPKYFEKLSKFTQLAARYHLKAAELGRIDGGMGLAAEKYISMAEQYQNMAAELQAAGGFVAKTPEYYAGLAKFLQTEGEKITNLSQTTNNSEFAKMAALYLSIASEYGNLGQVMGRVLTGGLPAADRHTLALSYLGLQQLYARKADSIEDVAEDLEDMAEDLEDMGEYTGKVEEYFKLREPYTRLAEQYNRIAEFMEDLADEMKDFGKFVTDRLLI